MGWRDRDYASETWHERQTAGPRFRWPSRAAGILIIVHIAAFVLMHLIASEEGGQAIVAKLSLSNETAHPLAVLLHPLATRDILTLILTVLVTWSLAGRVEQQDGWRRMASLYVGGNLLAGLAYFPLALLVPRLAGVDLDYPVGALAAWGVSVYRRFAGEMVMLFGKPRQVSHLVGIGLTVAVGLMLAIHRLGAIGWLIALAAGGCGEPVVRHLPALPALRSRRRRVVRPSIPCEPPAATAPAEDVNIDDILTKISREGVESLTDEERRRLEAARQAKLRESQDLNATR